MPTMPPVMSPIMMIVVIIIVVGAIIVSARVVIVSRVVIAAVIGSVIPRATAKCDTEVLGLRIVWVYRQQSKDRPCDHKKSFHFLYFSKRLDETTAADIRQRT